MKTAIVGAVGILLIVGFAQTQQNTRAQSASAQQRPSMQVVDNWPPPDSFEKLGNATPVIVRAVVLEPSRLRAVERGGTNPPTVIREQNVRIAEVIKNATSDPQIQVAAILKVGQEGGALEVNGREVSVTNSGAVTLNENEEYVFFLKPWPDAGVFNVAFGRAGLFRVRGEIVDVPSNVRHMVGLQGKSVSRTQFFSLLNRFRANPR